MSIFIFLFVASGIFVLFEQIYSDTDIAKTLARLVTTVFAIHLFFWMILGMVSNYLYELFRSNKGWDAVQLQDLLLPFFVSPIVFYSMWSIASGQQVAFVYGLVAFQNGFFWQ